MIAASIAFHLAERQRPPVVYERGGVLSACATSFSAGVVRSHHTAPCDVALASRSLATFATWPNRVGGSCGFQRTGFAMLVGPERVDELQHNASASRASGIAVSTGGPELVTDLFPRFSAEGVAAVAVEPDSGWADPRLTTSSFFSQAQARGAKVLEGVDVRAIRVTGNRVTGVETSMGPVQAESVVVANNYGAVRLLRPLAIEIAIVPRRIGTALVELPKEAQPTDLPACIDDTIGTYFRPNDKSTVLVGVPTGRPPVSGTDVDPISRAELSAALEAVSVRLPAIASGFFRGAQVAADGYTLDSHPVVGHVSGFDGLYLAAGFSGGGFKLAPAVGEMVAQELTSTVRAPELESFRPHRFTSGRLIARAYPYVHS